MSHPMTLDEAEGLRDGITIPLLDEALLDEDISRAVDVEVLQDSSGIIVNFRHPIHSYHVGSVVIEHYGSALRLHAWTEEEQGNDPGVSIDLVPNVATRDWAADTHEE